MKGRAPIDHALAAFVCALVFISSGATESGGLRSARADVNPESWFMLRISACVRQNPEALAQRVVSELGRLRDRPRATEGPVTLRVTCQGEQNILSARLPASGQTLVRILDLRQQPDDLRKRLLALAIAELLVASAGEGDQDAAESETQSDGPPASQREQSAAAAPAADPSASEPDAHPSASAPSAPHPASRSDGAPSARPPVSAARSRTEFPPLRLALLATAQAFFRDTLFHGGGGLGLGWDGARHIGLSLNLLASHGSAALDLGTASADTLSLGAMACFWHGWTRLRLRAGAGLRGGLVRLHGEPADSAPAEGDTFLGGWLGPALMMGATARIGARFALEITTEGGYVALPVTGQITSRSPGSRMSAPASAISIAGPFWGLQLGLGVFL